MLANKLLLTRQAFSLSLCLVFGWQCYLTAGADTPGQYFTWESKPVERQHSLSHYNLDNSSDADLLNAGHLLLDSGKMQALRKMIADAEQKHPQWCASHILLGKIAELEMDDNKALNQFRQALRVNPSRIETSRLYVDKLISLGHFKEAIAHIDLVMASLKKSSHRDEGVESIFCVLKARALQDMKDYKGAVAAMDLDQQKHKNYASARQLTLALLADRQWDRAAKAATETIKLMSFETEPYYLRGQAYAQLGKTQAAIGDLSDYLSFDPMLMPCCSDLDNEQTGNSVLFLRSELYKKLGRADQAKKDLEAIVSTKGQRAAPRNLPQTLTETQKLEQGRLRLIDQLGERDFIATGLGTVGAGNGPLLLGLIKAVQQAHPNWCAPYMLLAKIADLQLDDETTLQNYKAAVDVRPQCIWPNEFYVKKLIGQGQASKALVVIDKNLATIGNKTVLLDQRNLFLYCKAKAFRDLKNYKGAIAALELDSETPTDFACQDQLLEDLIADKQWARAVSQATFNLKLQTTNNHIYKMRGQAYAELDKTQQAIDDLTIFLEKGQKQAQSYGFKIAGMKELSEVRILRAGLYRKQGRTDLAKKEMEMAKKEQGGGYKEAPFSSDMRF